MKPVIKRILGCLLLALGFAVFLHATLGWRKVASADVKAPPKAATMPTPVTTPLGVVITPPSRITSRWVFTWKNNTETPSGEYQLESIANRKTEIIKFCAAPVVPDFPVDSTVRIFAYKDGAEDTDCKQFLYSNVIDVTKEAK